MFKFILSLVLALLTIPILAMEMDTDTNSLMLDAINRENKEEVALLLDAGANPDGKIGAEPILGAVYKRNIELCTLLLERGANPNLLSVHKYTPLMIAINDGEEQIARLLLQYGADPNCKIPEGYSIYTLMLFRCEGLCELLAESGARLETKDFEEENTFQVISYYKKTDLIPKLIHHANFNQIIPESEFQRFLNARNRILTTLMTFNRICPGMPKDIRKMILRSETSLRQDLRNCARFGKLKNIREVDAPSQPLQIVRLLLKSGQLDQEQTVARIYHHTINQIVSLVNPLNHEALKELGLGYKLRITEHDIGGVFGAEIEKNIRKRLEIPGRSWCAIQ